MGNVPGITRTKFLLLKVRTKKLILAGRQRNLLLKAGGEASRILVHLKSSFFLKLRQNFNASSLVLSFKTQNLEMD